MKVEAAEVVEELCRDRQIGTQLVERLYLPPVGSRFGELEPPLSDPIRQALLQQGVPRLWQHQVEGIDVVRRGENLLVTTPTASGKSLIFHLPVLEEAAAGGSGRALFLYPLKSAGPA